MLNYRSLFQFILVLPRWGTINQNHQERKQERYQQHNIQQKILYHQLANPLMKVKCLRILLVMRSISGEPTTFYGIEKIRSVAEISHDDRRENAHFPYFSKISNTFSEKSLK